MSKRIKAMEMEELTRRYGELGNACVVDVSRMDAISANRMRGELRELSIDLHVVRNRLASRALGDGALGPLVRNLSGPSALATGGVSVVDVAKHLARLADVYPSLTLREGIIDGDPELIPLDELAKMQSRTETLGEVVMLALSPGRRIAGALTGPGGLVAGCVKAVVKRHEDGATSEAA